MAIKPRDNETFYREVDEELRRDQTSALVKRWGWAVALGVVVLLAAIGGFLYWQHRQEVRAGERGERLTAVLQEIDAGQTKQAVPKLDALANEGSPGHRAAALLTKAAIAAQAGNDAAAAAGFKAVAEDEALAQPYRELALIRQTAIEFDTLPPAAVIQRLAPLARAGNPWFGSAGEMVALAHLKQGKPQLAAPIFAAIAKDDKLPQSMRSRAMQMAGALGVDAVQDSESTGEAPAAKETAE
ncbi:MAG TPA: tetratricopeptide repeat protein [Allosphingosinicella sp.]